MVSAEELKFTNTNFQTLLLTVYICSLNIRFCSESKKKNKKI